MERFQIMVPCAVCGRGATSYIIIGTAANQAPVCFKCQPLRRCGKVTAGKVCVGILESNGTPNDQGRHTCDTCGKHKRM